MEGGSGLTRLGSCRSSLGICRLEGGVVVFSESFLCFSVSRSRNNVIRVRVYSRIPFDHPNHDNDPCNTSLITSTALNKFMHQTSAVAAESISEPPSGENW